ncbi:UDP-N-acetylglucosamine--LPS N-acetylglucosamine transferase [Glutamicibacter sp. BW80]|uniref:PssD/Cps14F family polysaccharide biosynthesis glycosyltransferase n=1 Tax=Glutamicibacter sp. BW80 TaxID=2024404 RepID=UPI000BB7011D|nr:PssD/Cps14F family polysaccharide biosynthesis glycosyltransferase [Glutamicibacter sp. BW80]PCC27462.1 UDP-N-acetylglucosamine--LPS N-acetylglucosamine transferase [Glutamicibacter sp. BW80]
MGTLLFVGSSGGHLAQMLSMDAWWKQHRRAWVTFDTPDATSALQGEDVTWAYHPTTRNPGNAARNLWLSIKVLRAHRPMAVISTGAGVALPFFLTARLMGIPTVYVEVYDRIDSRTLTGRLCRPLSSEFCVQWEEQLKYYPGASVIGPLL